MASKDEKDALAHYTEKLDGFKAVDKEKNDTISKLLEDLEAAQISAQRASDDLEREKDNARRLQQRVRELEPLMTRRGFVLVLIDADADDYIFLEKFLNRNEAGGKAAADELYAKVREHIASIGIGSEDLDIVVRAYANIKDLKSACGKKGMMNKEADLNAFVHGFNQRRGLFDFVDVGHGKEEADNKIRENLDLYIGGFQCKHIILGVCHDGGYTPYLSSFASDSSLGDRITLLEGGTMSTRIRNIGFPRPPIRFDTVFSPKILTRATIIGSRPQSSSASQTLVNPEALTDRLELIRNENGQRIDKDLNVDPSSAKYGTSLIDDIINSVNIIVYRAIEAIEEGLLNIPIKQLGFTNETNSTALSEDDPECAKARDEIENGVHQLETLLEATVDKSFDKFEIYTLRNILTVPDDLEPWMRLSHYEGIQIPLPSSAASPESILALRRKLQETRKLNHALRSTHKKDAALLSQLNAILSPPPPNSTTNTPSDSLAFLTTPSDPSTASLGLSFAPKSKSDPLTTNAQFATSQLPALRKLVAELRPRVQAMKDRGVDDLDWEGSREERRQYIEGGVRRVVARDVGDGDGEMEGVERRVREDVEGLERIVGGMGGGEGLGERMQE